MMAGGTRWDNGFMLTAAYVTALAIVYMANSTGLITFNKFLMHNDRFPFAMFLGLVHMSCSFGFNVLLFSLRPSLYPSLTDPGSKVEVDSSLMLRVILPIATCFAGQLVLSNIAFMYSTIAFLQMMKQSNVVLVYLFSLLLALERFSWKCALVLFFVASATALTIHGEMEFSPSGFALQGCSMFCEGLKLTLQSYSLAATGRRLDSLTYVMLVAPTVLVVLFVFLLFMRMLSPVVCIPQALSLPGWEALAEYRWLLLGSGTLAFTANVSHASLIKNSSAIAFILAGVVMKDVLIVVVGSIVLGERLSVQQMVGFSMQLTGILAWSLMRAGPFATTASPVLGPNDARGSFVSVQPNDGELDEALSARCHREDDDCRLECLHFEGEGLKRIAGASASDSTKSGSGFSTVSTTIAFDVESESDMDMCGI
mmetsp:Transcript_137052/g.292713  ORF Transcript_137052/g.292713 Transcript_137052/m.292713 type:complete len:426 (-) Transcript_137052:94-1371(-)